MILPETVRRDKSRLYKLLVIDHYHYKTPINKYINAVNPPATEA